MRSVSIPPELEGLSFCLVKAKEKVPFEKNWQNKPYTHDDPKLQQHLQAGGNYGVICGYSDLMVLDVDDVATLAEVVDLTQIPPTFAVKTGGGGFHFYLKVTGGDHQKIVLKDSNGAHLGELQGTGTMVVGPGSVHPNGAAYTVHNDAVVAEISRRRLVEILSGAIPEEKLKKAGTRRRAPTSVDDDPFGGVSILDVIDTTGFAEEGGRLSGPHPMHGSSTGHNLVIDPVKNVWWCGRHETGGSVSQWLAVEAGLVDCADMKPGAVTGKVFLDVMEYAAEKGIIRGRAEMTVSAGAPRRITFDDVTYVDDKDNTKFSPDRAARAVLKAYNVISTPDGKILVYQDGIYEPGGDFIIEKALDAAAKDLANGYMKRETLAKIRLRTRVEHEELDADPHLFCVQNGVIDMRKGHAGFKPHDPKYRRTWKAPVVYDPEAKMVELEKFLNTALDEDGRKTLLDILAAKTTSINYEFFSPWIGRGQNGKTKTEELIRAFWGDDQVTEVEIATLGKRRFDLVELKGKSFLINSEVEGGRSEIRWIKHISGGGKVTADRKHLTQESFRPHCFIIYDCNRPPRFEDNTHGFNRRIAPIMWPYSFVDDPKEPYERLKDPHILEKITQPEELSGLLNVLIGIAPKAIETGTVHRVTSGEKIAEAYDMKAASGEIFWDRFVEEGYELTVPSSWLYEKYKEFCELVGASPIRDRAFNDIGRRLKYRKGRAYTDGGGRVQAWQKCGFNEDSWNEFLLDWTSTGPAEDQQKPLSGPARPPRPGNSGHDIDRTEIDGPDLYRGSIHDYAGPAGPTGLAIDSSCPVDQDMLVQDEDDGRIFGMSIPYYLDLGGGQLPTVAALAKDQAWPKDKAVMAIGLLKARGLS